MSISKGASTIQVPTETMASSMFVFFRNLKTKKILVRTSLHSKVTDTLRDVLSSKQFRNHKISYNKRYVTSYDLESVLYKKKDGDYLALQLGEDRNIIFDYVFTSPRSLYATSKKYREEVRERGNKAYLYEIIKKKAALINIAPQMPISIYFSNVGQVVAVLPYHPNYKDTLKMFRLDMQGFESSGNIDPLYEALQERKKGGG